MIDLLKLLEAALSLWIVKERDKYVDKVLSLKRQYNEEINKPYDKRSDAVLDNISFELKILTDAFVANVGNK